MTKKAEIKASLLEQLDLKNARVPYFERMVEDYMTLYDLSVKYDKDIKKRGICYEETLANGTKTAKNNPSNKERIMVVKQMLALLKDLGLTTGNVLKRSDLDDGSELDG